MALTSLTVLIVKADGADRKGLGGLVTAARPGVEVLEPAGLGRALAMLESGKIDCVVLSAPDRDTDGLDILREVRKRRLEMPVVAFVGEGQEELAVELMQAGAVDCVFRERVTPDRLARSLRRAVEGADARRELDQFVGAVTHELKTPLTAIAGWTHLLGAGGLSQEAADRALKIIARNVALMSERLEDLAGQALAGHHPRGGKGPAGAGPAANPSRSGLTPAPSSEPASGGALSGIRVLVIDDDDDALQLLAAFLRRHGARVATADSARSGLERRRDFTPDVLLSDLSMPGEDGFWLIERIRDEESRRRAARLPAAAVTALTLDQDRTRALAAGYDLHIPKPVRPDQLAAMVARLAGRPQA